LKKQVWVVTFHYDRGKSEIEIFHNKLDALRCIDVAVFKNEDCVNCSIHRKDIQTSDILADSERLLKIREGILGKM
jgi:hypothetical protein